MRSIIMRITLFSTILFSLFPFPAQADPERRTALVIGNSSYSTGSLKNPVNDADDMASTLKRLGFDVILKKNAAQQDMEDAIRDFGHSLKKGGVGLFFYAGHGVQISGKNFLLPIGTRIDKETDVKYRAVDADMVLDEMGNAGNPMNIVILDACRDNPFGKSFRTASRGLAIISSAPRGTLVSYSTSPGNIAADGGSRNSPYTGSLMKHMVIPGLPIEEVFKNVRQDLGRETGGKQIPWELSSLEGRFYFNDRVADRGDLTAESKRIDDERQRIVQERAILEKQRALEEERQKLESLKKEKTKPPRQVNEKSEVVIAHSPSPITTNEPTQPRTDHREFVSPTLGAKFVLIPAGTFMMGSPDDESGRYAVESPQHSVTISRSFYMQTTEVTQGQWRKVMGNYPSKFSNCGLDCPVERVSWDDVQEFIRKLNSMERADKYRLPTEAEWEYSARAGTTTRFHWGNQNDCSRANYGNDYSSECKGTNPGKTMRVGSFPPNPWGLYDMHGNVWEWVQDWQGNYPSGSITDPEGPSSGKLRVFRGGSWGVKAGLCRSANRCLGVLGSLEVVPGQRGAGMGFRLLRTVSDGPENAQTFTGPKFSASGSIMR